MTNFEKYEEEIKDVLIACLGVTKHGLRFVTCDDIDCKNCIFNGSNNCVTAKREWLEGEYVEPQVDWSKVAVDTPILVRDYLTQAWERRHFAKYENGKVFSFSDGRTSWSSNENETLEWEYAKLAKREEK